MGSLVGVSDILSKKILGARQSASASAISKCRSKFASCSNGDSYKYDLVFRNSRGDTYRCDVTATAFEVRQDSNPSDKMKKSIVDGKREAKEKTDSSRGSGDVERAHGTSK